MTWSDGSKQLLLGDEVLDIGELDNTSANQFLFVRHTGPVRFIQVYVQENSPLSYLRMDKMRKANICLSYQKVTRKIASSLLIDVREQQAHLS